MTTCFSPDATPPAKGLRAAPSRKLVARFNSKKAVAWALGVREFRMRPRTFPDSPRASMIASARRQGTTLSRSTHKCVDETWYAPKSKRFNDTARNKYAWNNLHGVFDFCLRVALMAQFPRSGRHLNERALNKLPPNSAGLVVKNVQRVGYVAKIVRLELHSYEASILVDYSGMHDVGNKIRVRFIICDDRVEVFSRYTYDLNSGYRGQAELPPKVFARTTRRIASCDT